MKFAQYAAIFAIAAWCSAPAFATASAAPPPSPISPPADMAAPSQVTEAEPAKPGACSVYQPDEKSTAIGRWSLRQRDDGQDWSGPWDIEFKQDGTWVQGGAVAGYWCQEKDLFVFGFSDDPHTTYRGVMGIDSINGVESWNGGGTGIFEAQRNVQKTKKKKPKK